MYDKRVEQYIFSLKNKIGQGSFGEVYAGINEKNGEKVAVKILNRDLINNDYHLKKCLLNEIRIMSQLKSPQIVRFLDVFETQNNYYIIQEYCQNGDLEKQFRHFIPGTSGNTSSFVKKKLLQGFLHLIKFGIMHRDLKPANILINDKVKNYPQASQMFKMGDFGFAKSVENFSTAMLSSLVGTPLYMSPQLLNREKYSNKSDIWSLGIIFYECLYGHTPWIGRNGQDLYANIMKQPLKFPETKVVSELAKNFIAQCLEIKEAKRLSWDDIYSHAYLSQEFQYSSILKNQNSLRVEDRTVYILNDLRQQILNKQIDLYKIFMKHQKKRMSAEEYHIANFLLSMNADLAQDDIQQILDKFNLFGKQTIEFETLKQWLADNQIVAENRSLLNVSQSATKERRSSVQVGKKTEKLIIKLKKVIERYDIQLKQLFIKYDQNQDGHLDEKELSTMLKIIDSTLTQQEIAWIFLTFDVNRDGLISAHEFIQTIENQPMESFIQLPNFQDQQDQSQDQQEVLDQSADVQYYIYFKVRFSFQKPIHQVFLSLPGPGTKLQQIINNAKLQQFN